MRTPLPLGRPVLWLVPALLLVLAVGCQSPAAPASPTAAKPASGPQGEATVPKQYSIPRDPSTFCHQRQQVGISRRQIRHESRYLPIRHLLKRHPRANPFEGIDYEQEL